MDFIKMRKNQECKQNRQNEKKDLQSCVFGKRLVSRKYKDFLQVTNKRAAQ